MSAKANSEQREAIEHFGGVLLSAGAGSGKTFVLTEHLLYLTQEWIKQYQENPTENFESYIKTKYSEVVMMTFTNKAAGEILIRIKNKFNLAAQNSDNSLWSIACGQIESVTISTIHGYCLKLMQMGLLKSVPSQIEILSDVEFDILITNIAKKWFLSKINQDDKKAEFLLRVKDEIIDSLKRIISDPILRTKWTEKKIKINETSQLDSIIGEVFSFNNFNEIFETSGEVKTMLGGYKKPWEDDLISFVTTFSEFDITFNRFIDLCVYFEQRNFKIAVTPRAKNVDKKLIAYYKQFKQLKDYIKENYTSYVEFVDKNQTVSSWYSIIYELITYVSDEYSKQGKLTFGDLEYLTLENLRDDQTAALVGREFQYIIVDEFQDTSSMQFEIINRIITNTNQLFCVGDLKQAIYGFRGGELEVFQNLEKEISANLSLNNNYRSKANIINFNNDIFTFLFKKSFGYEGVDPFQVEVKHQLSPIESEDKGIVSKLVADLSFIEDGAKLSNSDLDYLEALSLLEKIKTFEDGTISILYKKLKPSQILVKLLIQNNIGFTSQIKIPYTEDPIIGLFQEYISFKINQSESKKNLIILSFNSYLKLMGCSSVIEESDLDKLISNEKLFGLYNAFCLFIDQLKINISLYSKNLQYISKVIKSCFVSYEKIFKKIRDNESLSYSTEFQYGTNASNISIMSVHASKGLEFNHVLLGGIYTNDRAMSQTPFLGKIPLSFKWKVSLSDKKNLKTPYYLVESERQKYKEFSESKRLLYVGATRAEETLSWVELDLAAHKASIGKNTWSNALQIYEQASSENLILSENVDISNEYSQYFLDSLQVKKPLFHERSVGIEFSRRESELMFLSEMSVTRLAKIVDCSFCFYLSQILKLDSELEQNFDIEDLSSRSFKSSAKRGTKIHEEISDIILGNFDVSNYSSKFSVPVLWTVDKLNAISGKQIYISEKQIKFPVFNFMISGIPDLIVLSENKQEAQIWDFKTGAIAENESYWFQLMAYAYGVTQLYKLSKPIKLVLCYVDEQKILEKSVSISDVENYLWRYWETIKAPLKYKNKDCKQCN